MQHLKHLFLLVLLGSLVLAAGEALARQTELDGSPIPGQIYSSYQANWRKYAVFVGEVDGAFAVIPKYDRRLESSRGINTGQAMEKLKVQKEERNGNLTRKRVKYPDRADAEAYSKALPELSVGSYGWVASAEVVKIIDRKQMIVKEVWLVDRPKLRAAYEKDKAKSARENDGEYNKELLNFNYAQRIKMMEQQEDRDEGFERQFRLVGYDTRGLRVGDRWKGLNDEGFQVAVAYWEEPEPEEGESRRRRNDEPRLVLTEVQDVMRKTLSEEDFKKLLGERGMTVAAFVDLVRTVRERDRRNAEERILNAIMPPEVDLDD
ncbi:MAG: hypothetical protein KTR15_13075 [Phycisphaeraceae bacterium]|nr:hypothetical protein [Phycisphaeraceae bacterium]